jgi:hypothetical protein
MTPVTTILKGLLLLSLLISGVVMLNLGSANLCSGFFGWIFLSVLVWLVLAVVLSPILIIVGFVGKMLGL